MKRGEVYWADLMPRSGSGQTGRRPVILVSNDGFNQAAGWRSVIVVPVSTSASQARRGPTVIEIASGTAGLAKRPAITRKPVAAGTPGTIAPISASVAVCHQVTTLDRAKLSKRIGSLPPDIVEQLDEGLKTALDLD